MVDAFNNKRRAMIRHPKASNSGRGYQPNQSRKTTSFNAHGEVLYCTAFT
jgi:hypothetical protein